STAAKSNRSKSRSKTADTQGPTPHDSADRAESRIIENQPARVDGHSINRPAARNGSTKNSVGGHAQPVCIAGSRPQLKTGSYQWAPAGGGRREQRQHARRQASPTPAELCSLEAGEESCRVMVIDRSPRGLRLRSPRPYPANALLQVRSTHFEECGPWVGIEIR